MIGGLKLLVPTRLTSREGRKAEDGGFPGWGEGLREGRGGLKDWGECEEASHPLFLALTLLNSEPPEGSVPMSVCGTISLRKSVN